MLNSICLSLVTMSLLGFVEQARNVACEAQEKVTLLPGFGEQVKVGSCRVLLNRQELCLWGSRKTTLLPGLCEQVRVGLLSGFGEQARVVVVSLRVYNAFTGFWWASKGDTLAGFWWVSKSCCLRVLGEAALLLGFGEQVGVVLLLGFGEQARVVAYKT